MNCVVLPEMLKRKRGAIVTISSLVSMFYLPLFSCYGATKAACEAISCSLTHEKLPGVVFQTLIPSFVNTKILDYSNGMWNRLSFFAPDADSYAKSAIGTLALSNYTTGYLGHSLQIMGKFFPEIIQKYLHKWLVFNMFGKVSIPQ
ncbi:putative steroid dehydrogenase 1 [Centruroides sculpturatus]|uniref:putative steroid dehydrogenase 1 n=1 Tax=Centruroides sculpturatus TaxID=218467 RepID=UPI000C6DEEF6|nr:putative steroid dehydrogenase 1 [Centruroides sculpturatus]